MHFEEIGEKIKGHSLIYFTRPDGFFLFKKIQFLSFGGILVLRKPIGR